MKVVVDTNVLAYYLLNTQPFVNEIASFLRSDIDLLAPDSWRCEILM